MAEEIKITGKSLWTLFKNNIGTIIIIGGLAFNGYKISVTRGVESYQQSQDQIMMKDSLTDMKSDIRSIQKAVSIQNQQWTQFSLIYESDKKDAKDLGSKMNRGIIVLDTAMERHLRNTKMFDERIQFLKDQLEEKKNPDYLWIPSSGQSMTSALESKKITLK